MLEDLMMILSFADSVIGNDEAWDAFYAKLAAKHADEEAPDSKEMREMFHRTIHSVGEAVNLVTMLGKLNLNGAQIAGVQVVPMPGQAQAPKAEVKPDNNAELDDLLQRQYL